MDWSRIFAVEMPLLELIVRGSVIYWFLLLVFRFILHRDSGNLGMADMLLIVIVADAAQNGMTGEYKSVTEGLVLLSTILGWNWLIDFLAFRFRSFSRLTEPPPVPVIRHGQFVHGNLRKERLRPEEVMGALREKGISHLREVRHAYLESSGAISVIRQV
jgi:uncharacterized membrane protein YcaP (DUF421 family)